MINGATKSRDRVIATSLLPSEIAEAGCITNALREAGWPNANRSLVIREVLARLSEDLGGKTIEELFRDFIDRRGRRIARASTSTSAR